MFGKKLLALTLLGVMLLALPLISRAQQNDEAEANFVFINYIGQELLLDLDDVTYTIPGTNTNPEGGELRLTLDPGAHRYAANVAGAGEGAAGEFLLEAGETIGFAAELRETSPAVNREGILLDAPGEEVHLIEFDPNAPAVTPTPVVDIFQPRLPPAGQGSIVWINYFGGDELTIDLSGERYTVPPASGELPGRLQVFVAPGGYNYTVSVPNGSTGGEVLVAAGEIVGLQVTGERAPLEYDEGDEFEFLPPATLRASQTDLTAGATEAMPTPFPATVPETTPTPTPTATLTSDTASLLLKNYTGDNLLLTINNTAYEILPQAEASFDLPPGEYSYTTSIPGAATTGMVTIEPGQQTVLSVSIDFAGNTLSVYYE